MPVPRPKPGDGPAPTTGSTPAGTGFKRAFALTLPNAPPPPTLIARAPIFATQVGQFSKRVHQSVGITVVSQTGPEPFDNQRDKDNARLYDIQCQQWIAEAMKWDGRGVTISGNQGTQPELALIGMYLQLGYILDVNLFHQRIPLSGLRARDRPFIVDAAVDSFGVRWLYPVDGWFFHNRDFNQVLDATRRDWELEAIGEVLAILDTTCYISTNLVSFLQYHGAPIS